jgi:pyruvate formate lyase activating enzyme
MDVKNSPSLYTITVGWDKVCLEKVKASIDAIMTRAKDYEFRTTVMPELHTAQSIAEMGEWIRGAKRAFLQAYRSGGDVINPVFSEPDEAFMQSLKSVLAGFVEEVGIRGV